MIVNKKITSNVGWFVTGILSGFLTGIISFALFLIWVECSPLQINKTWQIRAVKAGVGIYTINKDGTVVTFKFVGE